MRFIDITCSYEESFFNKATETNEVKREWGNYYAIDFYELPNRFYRIKMVSFTDYSFGVLALDVDSIIGYLRRRYDIVTTSVTIK